MYHSESQKIYNKLQQNLIHLTGKTVFIIGDIEIEVEGKDGLGGLIEEWFGVWAETQGFDIRNPKKEGASQEFPDYFVGQNNGLLEVKAFDSSASANFDIANFESYCETVASNPQRVNSDYLIFSYSLSGSKLAIQNVWLKKIWEITCPSERWPIKTQTKRDIIYNIRPAAWYSAHARFNVFDSKEDFINALYETQEKYNGDNLKEAYLTHKNKED